MSVTPLIHGFRIAPDGSARRIDWKTVSAAPLRDKSFSWIHLNRRAPEVETWMRGIGGLEAIEADILLEEDTRPRCVKHGDAILLNLRGVNIQPDATPEAMIALRLYVHEDTVLTLRAYSIHAVEELVAEIEAGQAPTSPGQIVSHLARGLTNRIDLVISEMDDEVSEFEDKLLQAGEALPKTTLAAFRRRVLNLRRYILPQRDALTTLAREAEAGFSEDDRLSLRETAHQITRLAEDMDSIRERALVLQEQMMEHRSEAMNERLFLLAIISAVFLPLGFATGLFGVNVGGMPGVDNPAAFALLCIGMVLLAILVLGALRLQKWF